VENLHALHRCNPDGPTDAFWGREPGEKLVRALLPDDRAQAVCCPSGTVPNIGEATADSGGVSAGRWASSFAAVGAI